MLQRVCYIHIGPHKTGTSAIQWFLKQNRDELLKYGYFVPKSGTARGPHHPLARKLCGEPLPEHKNSVGLQLIRQLQSTPAEAVIVSSEILGTLLRRGECAKKFFGAIAELNLEPKLVVFPRHQPQWLNSRYAEAVRSCALTASFASFAEAAIRQPSMKYSEFFDVADAYQAELIARPFTGETMVKGVVPTFLEAIGIDPSKFGETNLRRNESVGPFTVAVARGLARLLAAAGKELKWRQATRCKSEVGAYLAKNGRADTGYCGLTTAGAEQLNALCQADNDRFARRAWGMPWKDVFAVDLGREFAPNDFEICPPGDATQRLLSRTIGELMPHIEEIMRDPTLAVDEPWNDLQQRRGWTTTHSHDAVRNPWTMPW